MRPLSLTRTVVVCCALFGMAATAQAPLDERVALVIGNAAYPNAPLANPANDAKAMGDTLRGLGFSVVELRDGNKAQMAEAIAKVRDQLKGKQGVGMLYYAGHGLQLDWRNYMVPVDAKLASASDVPVQTIDLGNVIDAFKAAGNRMNIVVLDACRDNPFTGTASGKGLAQLDAPPGTILAYATAPGNVADDGDPSGNGLYTRFLLQELVKPHSKIEDVFKRTRFSVRKASQGRQVPWESTSLEDDFLFNQGKVVAVAKPETRAREQAYQQEKTDWEKAREGRNVDELYAFLQKHPSGNFLELANLQLDQLQKPQVVPQPDAQGKQVTAFEALHRNGDRYEVVWKDGLTGIETARGTFEMRQRPQDGMFEMVVMQGKPPASGIYTPTGSIVQDLFGTYDPPLPAIPGGELKLGNRASVRAMLTPRQGAKFAIDWDGKVVAREKLDLAYGPTDVVRIDTDGLAQTGYRTKATQWYEHGWGYAVRVRVEIRPPSGAPQVILREVVARARKG